jgi:O-antigen ligase
LTFALATVLALPILAIFAREGWVWLTAIVVWLVFGGLFAVRAIREGGAFFSNWISGAMLLFALWGTVQLALGRTAHSLATASEAILWVALAVLFVASRSLFADPVERERFLDLALAFGAAVAAVSLMQFFSSGGRIYWWIPTEAEAVMGPFRNRNHYSSWILLLFPLAAVRALRREPIPALTAAVMAISILVGGSRAGIALLLAETAILFVLAQPRHAPALALLPLRDLGNRDDLYLSTIEMIRRRPLTGHGLGAYESVYPAFARFDNGLIVDHAHNDWLEWAAEVGLLPAALFAAVAAWSARAALRHPWALGVPAVFAHALVDYPMHKPAIAAWTVVLLAALAAAQHPTAPGGTRAGVP